jgi:hypothetical protein
VDKPGTRKGPASRGLCRCSGIFDERSDGAWQDCAIPPAGAGPVVEKAVDYFRESRDEIQIFPLAKAISFW